MMSQLHPSQFHTPRLSTLLAGLCLCLLPATASLAATPAEQVAAHLAAGEFQAATQIATAPENADAQESLLQQIANAQVEDGQLAASRATLNRLPKDAS